jgi:uncharacterized membrane protein
MEGEGKQNSALREMTPLLGGILMPAMVWGLQMQINYLLVRQACSAQRSLALYLVTIVALAITLVSAGIAWRSWRRSGAEWPSEMADAPTRTRFLAVLGILSSFTFFLVVLAQGIATVFFHPCQL